MDLVAGVTPHFGQYNVRALGWAVGDRSVIVPYSYAGVPFPAGVHRDTVPLWNALLDGLTRQLGVRLMNPGCWGYNNRSITGGGTPSFHSVGLALDVNAPANPYSASGRASAHTIPDSAAALARSLGMEWGGAWSTPKDYMHFEIHLTPDEVRAVASRLTGGNTPAPVPTGSVSWIEESTMALPVLAEGDGRKGAGERGRLHWYVVSLQALLNARGLAGSVPQDGVFGPGTTALVKKLQTRAKLPADGVVGAKTWPFVLGNDAPEYA